MRDNFFSLKIIFTDYGNTLLTPKWKGQTFNEPHARLYFIDNGSAEIWHSKKYFQMLPGDLLIVPPQANMKFRCRKSCKIIWLHFSLLLDGEIDIFNAVSYTMIQKYENKKKEIKEKMLAILESIEKNTFEANLHMRGLLLELISPFFPNQISEKFNPELELLERFKPLIEYIDRHCTQKLTLKDLAEKAGLEKTYFSSLFKKTYSLAPMQYVIKKRIEKAKRILTESRAKLSQVAEETGFNDAFHLSKTFKKITGYSPREFRKKLLQKIP